MERDLFHVAKDWKELKEYIIDVKRDLDKQARKARDDGDRALQMRLTDRYSSYDHILEMIDAFDEKYL
jgi:hypothetical protein